MKYSCIVSVLAACFLLVIVSACEKETTTGIPGLSDAATPQITSISPDTLYGGKSLVINGRNFSSDPNKNLVRFGFDPAIGYSSARADSGSESFLRVATPQVGGLEDITTRLSVTRSDVSDWSNELDITFKKILDIIDTGLDKSKGGITFDAEGNMYVGRQSPGEIYKITPDGDITLFGTVVYGEGEISFGPDGYLYVTSPWEDIRDEWVGAIRRIPPGGGGSETYITGFDLPHPRCIDWDDDENMYVMSTDGSIFRVTTPGPEMTEIVSGLSWGACLRVFNGYLYWWDRSGDPSTLQRAPITAEGVGDAELILEGDSYSPSGMAIDNNGNIYAMVGWGLYDIIKITPDGRTQTLVKIPTENPNFAAFDGEFLYVTAGNQGGDVYKIYLGVGGVPCYRW